MTDAVMVAIVTSIPASIAAVLGFINRRKVSIVDGKQDQQVKTLGKIETATNGNLSRALDRIKKLEAELDRAGLDKKRSRKDRRDTKQRAARKARK